MIDIAIHPGDIDRFKAAIKSAETQLGKSGDQALRWGAVNLMISLAAATIKSKTLRPIVKNPLFKASADGKWTRAQARQAKGDTRRARFGVNRWHPQTSRQYFQPILRTGEFGKYRFFERNGMWFRAKLGRGRAKWEKIEGIPNSEESENIPSIKNSKKRKIGRSGLARKAWKWAQAHMIRGGIGAPLPGVPNLISVKVSSGGNLIQIDNRIRYATTALQGGESRIAESCNRAAASMEKKIALQLSKITKK
ncbi:hypothetical protein M0R72_20740 [Candidatus Pacearchaeota archaeon]|jgi:hypothetical protein|nr:hypothetical protein [Candidatus Pacearchaeota archaeon]